MKLLVVHFSLCLRNTCINFKNGFLILKIHYRMVDSIMFWEKSKICSIASKILEMNLVAQTAAIQIIWTEEKKALTPTCCCKYLHNQACPFQTGLARRKPSEVEVCWGGATIHPHTNAAYTCRNRLQERTTLSICLVWSLKESKTALIKYPKRQGKT